MTKRSWVGTPAPYFWMDISHASYKNRCENKLDFKFLQDGRIRHVSSNIQLQNELPFPMILCFASYDIKLFLGKVRLD
jgi:hypothetical protein